jgi:hypothetical protein
MIRLLFVGTLFFSWSAHSQCVPQDSAASLEELASGLQASSQWLKSISRPLYQRRNLKLTEIDIHQSLRKNELIETMATLNRTKEVISCLTTRLNAEQDGSVSPLVARTAMDLATMFVVFPDAGNPFRRVQGYQDYLLSADELSRMPVSIFAQVIDEELNNIEAAQQEILSVSIPFGTTKWVHDGCLNCTKSPADYEIKTKEEASVFYDKADFFEARMIALLRVKHAMTTSQLRKFHELVEWSARGFDLPPGALQGMQGSVRNPMSPRTSPFYEERQKLNREARLK